MRRKIIKQRDSYTVTLPIKWVKRNHIDKTAEIDVEEKEDEIVIKSESKQTRKKVELELSNDNKLFMRYVITNSYRAGYDLIRIKIKEQKQIKIIEEILNEALIGFEITQTGDDFCIIESVSEPADDKNDMMLRRIFLIIKDSLERTNKFFVSGRIDLEELKNNNMKIDKYSYFCRRTIAKQVYSEKSQFKWMLLSNLVNIQHSILRIAKQYAKEKKVPSKPFDDVFKKTISLFNEFYEAFFEEKIDKLSAVTKFGESILYADIYSSINSTKEGIAFHHLAELVRLIFISVSPACGIIIKYETIN